MKGEIKLYKKVIKLTNAQIEYVINTYCSDCSPIHIEKTISLLKARGAVKIDRTNLNKVIIQWLEEQFIIYASELQNCRLVIVSAVTAKDYAHFYKNLYKKFKK